MRTTKIRRTRISKPTYNTPSKNNVRAMHLDFGTKTIISIQLEMLRDKMIEKFLENLVTI